MNKRLRLSFRPGLLDLLKSHYGYCSDSAFSAYIGVDRNKLSRVRKGQQPPCAYMITQVAKLHGSPDLNAILVIK
ncbi:hypothetical protein AB0H76_13135 [Nocardia sp. NPDC050712]|uniref:hypothetical protein n=1 Tax=Nocardia sp. NPDC050712 TaxID=3155518 RepID=UPI0033E6A48C